MGRRGRGALAEGSSFFSSRERSTFTWLSRRVFQAMAADGGLIWW